MLAGWMAAFGVQPAEAAVGSQFNAGRIIDDAVFFNNGAMTANQIQDFLNQEVPTCDNAGNLPFYGTYNNISYNGNILRKNLDPTLHPAPFTCLKQYYENTTTHENNIGSPGTVPAGAISAAQMIYNAAQTSHINPRVLIVLLQKEEGLVQDDWPWDTQYQKATGFGCPDTGPNNTANCNSAYYGFYNQVSHAAAQFRNYTNNPNSFNYTVGLNTIKWNPNAACGTAQVNIYNQATADLYDYTPYVPNAAALSNLYGTGDGCSSYGNRNFWRYYTDWFGSTWGDANYAGFTWHGEELDGSSDAISGEGAQTGQTTTTITLNGVLHVFYYESGGGNLRHAWSDTNGWHFETLDGDSTTGGRTSDDTGWQPKVIVYNNALHVFYHDKTAKTLRHAWSNAGVTSWQYETLDGAGGANGRYTADLGYTPAAMTFGASGVQLFYYDLTNGNLRHAWTPDGSTWNFENLDGDPGSVGHLDGDIGQNPAVTYLAPASSIQLYYYDYSHGNLRHAWSDATGWHFENLDGDPGSVGHWNADVGRNSAVAVYNNGLQLFYYDFTNGNLRHAWTTSTGWHFENLDGDPGSVGRLNSNVGENPTIVADESIGKLGVFYYDHTYGNLRGAVADSAGWHFANIEGDNGSLTGLNSNVGMGVSGAFFSGTLQLFFYDQGSLMLRHAWGTP
jgi:hypothetical protein